MLEGSLANLMFINARLEVVEALSRSVSLSCLTRVQHPIIDRLQLHTNIRRVK